MSCDRLFIKPMLFSNPPFKLNRFWKSISVNTLLTNTKYQPHNAIASLQPHIFGTSSTMVMVNVLKNRRISRRLPFFLE